VATFKAGFQRRLLLAKTQFIEAYPFLVLVGSLLAGGLITELTRKLIGADWIYSCGMAIEVIGILFVAVEIVSVRNRVGKHGFLRASFGWLSRNRYFFFRPKPITGELGGIASISFVGGAQITNVSKSNRLSDRVEALEANFSDFSKELAHVKGLIGSTERSVTAMLNEKTQMLTEKLERQKELIAEIAAGDSAFKLVGVFLVLLGFIVQNFPSVWAPAPLL
jgi:hypothetical protein